MLQASTLTKLETTIVWDEENQSWKGRQWSGQGVRLWGLQVRMLSLYNWISISKLESYCSSPIGGPYCWKSCLFGEVPEDEEEMEEPESSTREQARFAWAWVWVEEGGSPALEEGKLQSLLVQVLSLKPLPSWSCSLFLLSLPLLVDTSGYLISSLFCFKGCISYIRPVTCGRKQSTCDTRWSAWRPKAFKRYFAVARSKAKSLYDIWQVARTWPELTCLLAYPCLKGIGMCQPHWSQAQQPKSLGLQPQRCQLRSMGLQPWTQQPKSLKGAC